MRGSLQRGGHSWPLIDGGDGPLLPFINCGCGWSWPFIDPSGGHLLMVVMGSCGRSSILVMGTMDDSGPYRCPSILEVGFHGQCDPTPKSKCGSGSQ